MKALVVAVVLVVAAGSAEAYPQFQLSRDQTCTGCHISPAGGGMLNENGLSVAEGIAKLDHAPEFMYGKVPTPDWLQLGGDFRGAGGYIKTPESFVYAFPMQMELNANAKFGAFSVYLNVGGRPATEGNEAATYVWAREHYVMWKSRPDENEGLFVRAGHFMPVFGLRFAEHPMYTRRFGGTQLYSDTYGLAVEYVTAKMELHATGFIEDPVLDPVEHASGGALYAETRTSETMSFGVEGMFKNFSNGEEIGSSELKEFRLGVTNKIYLESQDLLLQTEIQFINQLVGKVDRSADSEVGGAPKGFVGNIVASKMLGDNMLLDLGLGHFDSNFRISNLDRDCVDVNLHYFTSSHLELIFNGRYELMAFGSGGDPGAYGLLQVHYRL